MGRRRLTAQWERSPDGFRGHRGPGFEGTRLSRGLPGPAPPMRVFPQPPESKEPRVPHTGKQRTQSRGVGSSWGPIAGEGPWRFRGAGPRGSQRRCELQLRTLSSTGHTALTQPRTREDGEVPPPPRPTAQALPDLTRLTLPHAQLESRVLTKAPVVFVLSSLTTFRNAHVGGWGWGALILETRAQKADGRIRAVGPHG